MPDCPCDVWCRGLTTCFQYVGPRFWKSSLNDDKFVSLTYFFLSFSTYILMPHNMIIHYFYLPYFHYSYSP